MIKYTQAWLPSKENNYLGGFQGECEHRPSNKTLDVAIKGGSIVDIFLLYADLNLWTTLAKYTEKYANIEWVVQVDTDRGGQPLKKHISRNLITISKTNATVRENLKLF